MLYTTILSVAVATLQLSPKILTSAIPVSSSLQIRAVNDEAVPFPFDEADASAIENAFATITSIPDSVIDDGDEAVRNWVQAHNTNNTQLMVRDNNAGPRLTVRDDEAALEPRQGFVQVAKCAFAIGKAIAENVLPVRRVKALIFALGGARRVAKLLLKAKSIRELIILGGPELQELAEILLGITDVVNACFEF